MTQPLIEVPTTVSMHGFLAAIEVDPGTDLNAIVQEIYATLAKNPGIREFDLEHLGEIEQYDEGDAFTPAEMKGN